MTRARTGLRKLVAPLLAALAACQGSDPQPLELVSLDDFGDQGSLIGGGGGSSTLGYTSSSDGPVPSLRLVRHAAATPDRLELLGDVRFVGSDAITRLRVTDEAAALIVGGRVWVVDPSDPLLATEAIPTVDPPLDVAVSGRWVAIAVERGLVLVHRDAPSAPFPFVASSTPTALLATAGAFLAFTTAGYVVADVSSQVPTFQEVGDPVLGGIRAVAASSGRAWVAGPGPSPGRSRVLQLDLAAPGRPVALQGRDLPGAFVAFAWDGGGTSVVAIHGEGDDVRPESFHQGHLVRETIDGLSDSGVPLPFWSQSRQPFAAHANHLLAAQAGGVALLRIR